MEISLTIAFSRKGDIAEMRKVARVWVHETKEKFGKFTRVFCEKLHGE